MGTRSLTFVYDGDTPLINLYRQYDGYPTGHGAELAEFLNGFAVGNGMSGNEPAKYANGAGCLAAQLVSNFKGSGPGQFYLHSVDATDCGQDYEYRVFVTQGKEILVSIVNKGCNMFGMTQSDTTDVVFTGTVSELVAFCTEKETA
jgi:hypothetical protein